jgi:TrmH family RNA methyltransferase
MLESLPETGALCFDVTPEVFAKLAFGDRAEGIVAVARTPERLLSDLNLPDCALVAVLEGLEKPGNLGAVLRTADAAGVSGVLVVDGGTDVYNPAAIRASLGAIFRIPVRAASVADAFDWLQARHLSILAATPRGDILYRDADYRGATAVVLGSEARGLSTAWNREPCVSIRLPMLGTVDSLNVASTAAVIFYEALRQRA